MATTGNAVIGQSGGPTSVINQSLVGVIEEVRKSTRTSKSSLAPATACGASSPTTTSN
ncbi:MAG: hypothetical protein QM754_13685 [Tepidisphaeraceae bacterium]